jgi:hypothetical protein
MGLASDFVEVRCPCGALWRGAMASPIANMDSTYQKERKEKNIVDEDMKLCHSILHVSQDLIITIYLFWD